MAEQLPDLPDEAYQDRAKRMLSQLASMVKSYEKDRRRIKDLITFAPRECATRIMPISQVRGGDRPEVELYLWHRDNVARLEGIMLSAKQRLEEAPDAQNIGKALNHMVNLEGQKMRHVQSMERILENLSHEQGGREAVMARLAADGAHLAQAALQHKDKMDLARKTAQIPSEAEIKEKLALKYNVPLTDVEALLVKDADYATEESGASNAAG